MLLSELKNNLVYIYDGNIVNSHVFDVLNNNNNNYNNNNNNIFLLLLINVKNNTN